MDKMLNAIASSEAIYSAKYVDNYIDSVENLPDDVQRHLSRIRDIDVQYRGHLRDVDYYYDLWKSLSSTTENSANRRARAISRMQTSLIHAQELGDEKMQIVTQLQELIDYKTRQLDSDQKNLDLKEEQHAAQQQHALRGIDDAVYCGTPPKASRSQSPNIGIPLTSMSGIGTSSGAGQMTSTGIGKDSSSNNAFSSINSISGGINAAINERSSAASNIISGAGSSNGSNYSNSYSNNISSSKIMTSAYTASGGSTSKRPRRQRNEIVNVMELGGNESNSANEGGGSGDRGSSSTGASQKQSSSNQSLVQKKTHQSSGQSGSVNTTNAGGASTSGGSAGTSKKKKRKARGGQASNAHSNAREDTPPVDPIDPDEPTYCLCDQISFGEMILCDNDLCPIEWFHFSCVSLVFKPKGKWYCPNCRGDRPNVMKPKAQFLKELERYNKEKEEKT